MSSKTNVGPVYKGVILDVLKNVRDKFLNEGVDEQVLQELKQLWETKLQQSRAVDDLEVTGKAAAHQTLVYPHNQMIPSKVQMTVQGQTVQMPVVQNLVAQYPGFQHVAPAPNPTTITVKPKPSQLDGTRPEIVDSPVGATASKQKRRVVVQLDGSKDGSSSSEEDDEEGGAQEAKISKDEEEDDEASLNSSDDQSDEEEEVYNTDNLVVCQFDKVGRVRNKWRFSLKDGIMNLSGKDYVFHKATGEAEW